MEVRGYKSGAMCNPKISFTELKLTPRGIPGSARASASAESEVCHSSVNHPHTWKCAPTSSAKTGLRSHARHPTFTQTVQELNIFVSKLKETGKTHHHTVFLSKCKIFVLPVGSAESSSAVIFVPKAALPHLAKIPSHCITYCFSWAV